MTFTEKCIELSVLSSASYGVRLKDFVAAMVANVPGMEIVSVTTETDAVYDVTLSYMGITVQLYNSTYAYYCVANGYAFGKVNSSAPARSDRGGYVSIKLASNGHVCVKLSDLDATTSSNTFCLDIMPITCEMTDGTLKNVVLVWFGGEGYNVVRSQIPSFAPATLAVRMLCDPDTGAAYAVGANNAAGTFANYKGKAEVTPFAVTSEYGEIAAVTYNGYPLYKIQIAQGQSLFSYSAPGFMQVTIAGATFLEIGTAVFARLS